MAFKLVDAFVQLSERGARVTTAAIEKLRLKVAQLGGTVTRLAVSLAAGFGVKEIIRIASDAEEVANKFRAVFKQHTAEMDKWIATVADRFGRSTTALRDWSSQLQDTFVPLGFARDRAATLSKELTLLSIDLASFYNQAEPEVIGRLTSAMVGNHEAVRSFGIIITQATLNLQLAKMGFSSVTKGATEQQKVLARLAIITASTADAQGDVIRSQGSFAETLRQTTASAKELADVVGRQLLPPLKDLLNVASGLAGLGGGGGPGSGFISIGVGAAIGGKLGGLPGAAIGAGAGAIQGVRSVAANRRAEEAVINEAARQEDLSQEARFRAAQDAIAARIRQRRDAADAIRRFDAEAGRQADAENQALWQKTLDHRKEMAIKSEEDRLRKEEALREAATRREDARLTRRIEREERGKRGAEALRARLFPAEAAFREQLENISKLRRGGFITDRGAEAGRQLAREEFRGALADRGGAAGPQQAITTARQAFEVFAQSQAAAANPLVKKADQQIKAIEDGNRTLEQIENDLKSLDAVEPGAGLAK